MDSNITRINHKAAIEYQQVFTDGQALRHIAARMHIRTQTRSASQTRAAKPNASKTNNA